MRFLVVSNTGFGLGFAPMVEFAGHAVTRCSIPTATEALEESLPDILIYDNPECAHQAEEARNKGVKVLGASRWSSILESNPEYKDSLIKAIGYTKALETTTGIPCEIVAWFNGNNFIARFIAFNYSKFLAGNLGIPVVSSGYVAAFSYGKSKLVSTILDPLEKFLRKVGHRGVFSVSTIVDYQGNTFVKDVTANLNRPWTQALYANINKRNGASVLLDMFNETSSPVQYIDRYVAGIMVSVAPYPYALPQDPVEIRGVNPQNQKHLWQMDLTKIGDKYYSGKLSGIIGYATSRGSTVEEAARRAYRVISNLSIENVQYRTDIGRGVAEKVLNLSRLGVLPRT